MFKRPAATVDNSRMGRLARSFACSVVLLAAALPGVASADDDEPPRVRAPSTATSGVAATQAKLAAIVDPRGSATTVHFEVGRTTSYGFNSQEKSIPYLDSVKVWISIYGLAPSTHYHFRAVATNANGVTTGPDLTFTTPAGTGSESLTDVEPSSPLDPMAPGGGAATDPLRPATPLPSSADTTPIAPTGTGDRGSATGAVPVLVPERAKTVVVEELSGQINWRAPGGRSFNGMSGVGAIPVGAVIDARRGRIGLSTDAGDGIDSGQFWGAVFEVRQSPAGPGVTELALRGGRPGNCERRGGQIASSAARKDKNKSRGSLWGKDHKGHFRTRGRNSVAAVRGTLWYTAERCAGTLTRVVEGAVEVRDIHRGTKVLVKAGQHLMVRDRAARRR